MLIYLHHHLKRNRKQNSMDIENSKAQMRKGVLELCILSILNEGEHYPTEILEQMKKAELLVVEGTIYPLLTRLKNDGLLNYRWVESTGGPPRKYFTLTADGKKFLKQLRDAWREMNEAISKIVENNS
ncbi:MAG: PadR family transcriptional regulator [Chitinophagales bacterium]|nr:PadR family transcriptional regulator [Chitinophagales bacterium]HRN95198.1 PadR family transcriptional regulator [Chitinophagales bacterium]HRP38186.1 PadR family transcriptional regulator [Chitinophagales bacterium]